MPLPNSKYAVLLTVVLAVQGGAFYAVASRSEVTPTVGPLASFPDKVGQWTMVLNAPIEKEVLDVLRADDTLNRVYANPSGAGANFFIGYFKTQRTGSAPHSPKNCLPGSGWEPVESPGTVAIPVAGRADPIVVNRYVVARGDQRSVVLYWYQSHDRVIASEFSAKFWLIADAVRYRRSDTALVKIVVPVRGGGADASVALAIDFIRAAFPLIAKQLPV